MSDLAKRAVACKRWRWREGMLSTHRARIVSCLGTEGGEDVFEFAVGGSTIVGGLDEGELPDLTDPATIGCILALAREAWQAPALQVSPARLADGSVRQWICYPNIHADKYVDPYFFGATEAEALIAALEAAP